MFVALHNNPLAGHQGFINTYRLLMERFAWERMKEDVWKYVKECTILQVNKVKNEHPPRMLQPLSILKQK